jgi:predicted metal-dependent hydrolase
MKPPRKKRIEEIDRTNLEPPALDEAEWQLFRHGVALFNDRQFWEAHEAWEEVWKGRAEESRIFFQAIIQAAAAYHLIVTRPRYRGARNNFAKVIAKLELFTGNVLGIDVDEFHRALQRSQRVLEELGEANIGAFPEDAIPTITLR